MCSWNIENALDRCTPLLSPKKHYISPKSTKFVSTEITQERLQQSYQIAASVVKEYGDIYLKIFERMHNEMEEIEIKQSLLDTALKVANKEQRN